MFGMIYFVLIRKKIMTKIAPYFSNDKLPDKSKITNINTFKSNLKRKKYYFANTT